MKYSFFNRIISMVLAIIMTVLLLPLNTLAEEYRISAVSEAALEEEISAEHTGPITDDSAFAQKEITAEIVCEVEENRTEYTKEYLLDNGMQMAVVYPSAVHYQENGEWVEIDNSLCASMADNGMIYSNRSGVWTVSFPQTANDAHPVVVEKDGYTLSFRLTGVLESLDADESAEFEVLPEGAIPGLTPETEETEGENSLPNTQDSEFVGMASESEEQNLENETQETAEESLAEETVEHTTAPAEQELLSETEEVGQEAEEIVQSRQGAEQSGQMQEEEIGEDRILLGDGTYGISYAEEATAQVTDLNTEAIRNTAQYPETVMEKIASQLVYSGILENTSVVYDLNSNCLKESIIMEAYDPNISGYCFSLNIGNMIPEMQASGKILLYDAQGENVVMVMPAPYLYDAKGKCCGDISVELQNDQGSCQLTYLLPTDWLADESREWPVVLDPVIQADLDINNIQDQTVFQYIERDYEWGMLSAGYDTDYGIERFYVGYAEIPALSSADVIVNASMQIYRPYSSSDCVPIEVHKVNGSWTASTLHWRNAPSFQSSVDDYQLVQGEGYYTWNVTDIVRNWYASANTGMVFKASPEGEAAGYDNYKLFYSCNYSMYYQPTLTILFVNNTGLEGYWDYTTTSIGRAGTGYVNNYTGNLVLVREDMGFSGNRMPVSISHVYNANDKANNSFGMGYEIMVATV